MWLFLAAAAGLASDALCADAFRGQFDSTELDHVRVARDNWSWHLHEVVEEFYNGLPIVAAGRRGYPNFHNSNHNTFDLALGPVGPVCRGLEAYGVGDDEKRVCGLGPLLASDKCLLVSLGSNNQWGYEREMLARTNCSIAVFDCTIAFQVPQDLQTPRLTTHELCITNEPFVNERGWKFVPWDEALRLANIDHVTHLKMDIEGFEYKVLASLAESALAPQQVSVELHFATQMSDLRWNRRYKTPAEIALFIKFLYDVADYFVLDRHDNEICEHCSELVLGRFVRDKPRPSPQAAAAAALRQKTAGRGQQQQQQQQLQQQHQQQQQQQQIQTPNKDNAPIDECAVAPHHPRELMPVPVNRGCCAWLLSIETEGGGTPPKMPPAAMLPAFTLWGKTKLQSMYFDQHYFGGEALTSQWTEAVVDEYVSLARSGRPRETYGGAARLIMRALEAHPVADMRGAVVGSEKPWVEALLLAAGAAHVTTIEYGSINSTHPQVSTLTPAALLDTARHSNLLGSFDFVATYSSLEHSGLGRYGDALAPFGDLEWIERVKCLLKPGGFFYFGVPMSDTDCLVFNAHRIYGPQRLAHVKRGFIEHTLIGNLATGCGMSQPILVLQKEQF